MTEISKVLDVLLLLGRKQQSFVHRTIVLFTLHAIRKVIICCLKLNTRGGSDDNLKVDYAVGWRSMYYVVMPNQVSEESR